MARAKQFTADDAAQSARFVEAARKEGIEKIGTDFERGLAVLAPKAKPNPKTPARKPKRAKRR